MPHNRNHISKSYQKGSDVFQMVSPPTGLQKRIAVDGLFEAAPGAAFCLHVPSDTQVVTRRGVVLAATLQSGDYVVGRGGLRRILDVQIDTAVAPIFRISRGIFNLRQSVCLRADQLLQIADARVLRLFGMLAAIIKVEDLNGLEGIANLGALRHVSVTLTLEVNDAVYAETLWLRTTESDADWGCNPLKLSADEARLLLVEPFRRHEGG